MKWGLLSRNPADAVDPPRARRKEMQTWSQDKVLRCLDVAKGSQYHAIFYLALFSGMRRSELLALRWCDLDLPLCQLHVTRGLHHLKDGSYVVTQPKSEKSRRTIALPPSAALVLREYREKREADGVMLGKPLTGTDLVLGTVEGEPLRPNTVTRAWAMLAAKAGVKVIRLHDARHSHASLLLSQNVHPKVVQERLGHSSISITLDIYSHISPGLQEAAAQRFDDLVLPRQEKRAAVLAD